MIPHDFANPGVAPDSLPDTERIRWHPLHPRFARRLQMGVLIRILIVGTGGAAAHIAAARGGGVALIELTSWLLPTAWALYGVLALRALLWPLVAVPRRGYAIRARDIHYRTGVFWRSAWSVPFNRIQHTQIDSTPLDRRFGLASLSVFPAGGGAQEIRGLGAALAGRLRAHIAAQIEREEGQDPPIADADSPTPAPEDPPPTPPTADRHERSAAQMPLDAGPPETTESEQADRAGDESA